MSEKYKCDKCGEEVDWEDVVYYGTDHDECSPFVEMECYCKRCLSYEESN